MFKLPNQGIVEFLQAVSKKMATYVAQCYIPDGAQSVDLFPQRLQEYWN